ncbi:hypothetical protein K9M79_07965 [Candidatus Woesearchaeota archaeon]|nr:hypothetical protein [Candidatus Woesearchaeota archaeon]
MGITHTQSTKIFICVITLLFLVATTSALTRQELKLIIGDALVEHFENDTSTFSVEQLQDLVAKYDSGEDPIDTDSIGPNSGMVYEDLIDEVIEKLKVIGVNTSCEDFQGQTCYDESCSALFSCAEGTGTCPGLQHCCAGSCTTTAMCTCDTIPGQCESGCDCDPDCSGLPDKFYWNNEGGSSWDSDGDGTNHLTGVKDQGTCGSCWAFATVASVENKYKLVQGSTIDLSEQDLLSCGSEAFDGLKGCGGAQLHLIGQAFSYTQYGLATESNYPYTDINAEAYEISTSPCVPKDPSYKSSYWKYVAPVTDGNIKKKIRDEGPLFTVLNMGSWMVRKDGTCSGAGSAVDHAVVVVGWDEEGWIIRNSWGPINYWAHKDGYFKVNYGQCNIHYNPPEYPMDISLI